MAMRGDALAAKLAEVPTIPPSAPRSPPATVS
jgi:hypothetical protein